MLRKQAVIYNTLYEPQKRFVDELIDKRGCLLYTSVKNYIRERKNNNIYIYLAGPLFTSAERKARHEEAHWLRSFGYQVFNPLELNESEMCIRDRLLIDTGLQQVALIPSMPEDVFVYNGDMNDPGATEYILKRLDREHYINDAQKKLNDYLGIKPERVRKPRNQKITIHVYNEQEFTDLELLLKGKKEWLQDEGMIGELQYSKNEDLLTIINKEKTFTLKLEKNILIQPLVCLLYTSRCV